MPQFLSSLTRENLILQIGIAAFLFFLGLILAFLVRKFVRNFLEKIGLKGVIKRLGWREAFNRVGIEPDFVKFFSEIGKWMVIIIFLMLATEILGIFQFSQFLAKIVGYFQNIVIASLIFIATLYLVDFTYRVFLVIPKDSKLKYSKFFSIGLRRAIWILAGLAILYQLQIVPHLILALFVAILALIVLALGISFGLGGKEIAKKILEEWKEKLL
jgi:hypothetical protein